jgi:hypothetical protein
VIGDWRTQGRFHVTVRRFQFSSRWHRFTRAILVACLSLFLRADHCGPTTSSDSSGGLWGAGDFSLRLGESTRTGYDNGEVRLTFLEVQNDNRCPVVDTFPTCIVADGCTGTPTARVVLKAETASAESHLTYAFGACDRPPGGTQDFASVSLNVYMLRPQVESDEPIAEADYFVRISVKPAP